jgi:Ca2+/Na+ antiporter
VGGLDKIDIIFAFEQNEYARAVRQYLLAGSIVKRLDLFVLPLLSIILLAALFYTRFNRWVLLLTLLCLAVVLLICYLFFLKPWYDYNKKPHLRKETQFSFTENGIILPETGPNTSDIAVMESIKNKKGGRQENYLNWDLFAEAWENRDFFFLIQQPHIYYMIPKRAFANQEELQYFLKMLYRRVGIVESVGPYQPGREHRTRG